METRINRILPRDFVSLQIRSGNEPKNAAAATKAIMNSQLTVGIFDKNQLMAFGRVVGDGALIYLICDLMVDPRYARKNLIHQVLHEINDYLLVHRTKGSKVYVIADTPLDKICRKYGFKYLDSDFRVAMVK